MKGPVCSSGVKGKRGPQGPYGTQGLVESTGGVQTLRNVSAYHEPAWHFDAKFVDRQAHARANV